MVLKMGKHLSFFPYHLNEKLDFQIVGSADVGPCDANPYLIYLVKTPSALCLCCFYFSILIFFGSRIALCLLLLNSILTSNMCSFVPDLPGESIGSVVSMSKG